MAVGMAAWATHGLGDDTAAKDLVHKASYYQLTHAMVLVAATHFGYRAASALFALGLLLFPTTLYLLGIGWNGVPVLLTPLGGGCLIAGWLAVALGAWRRP